MEKIINEGRTKEFNKYYNQFFSLFALGMENQYVLS